MGLTSSMLQCNGLCYRVLRMLVHDDRSPSVVCYFHIPSPLAKVHSILTVSNGGQSASWLLV